MGRTDAAPHGALYALGWRVGRRRKPEAPLAVTVVLASGESAVVPADSPLGKAMGEVARLLAHW